MGKFTDLTMDILSVFGSVEWQAEGVKAFPSNYTGENSGDKYIRVHVLPSGVGLTLNSASGQVIIDIFTPAGAGPLDSVLIADRLDAYLAGKSKQLSSGTTQFGKSSLVHIGIDKGNEALHRSQYVITFNHFGV